MALHQGFLVSPEGTETPAHFVLQLPPAEA
jgi:hypothetical protein